MADVKLSFAMTAYDRMLPLISGEVKPDGIELEYQGMPGAVPRVFYEQIKFHRYDVSEMSMSSFLRMRPVNFPYRMLPVFHNRAFSYTNIFIRSSSGARQDHPEDLKGKNIGIGDYQQSIGLWSRGIFEMEWGVKPEDMIWHQERGEHFSHTGASAEVGLSIPEEVELHYAKENFATMYLAGTLDASNGLGASAGSGIDRRGAGDARTNPDVVPLFSDRKAEGIRFFQKHGVYPPHHVTVVRESVLEEHPWVAVSLMEAFNQSKALAAQRLRALPPTMMVFGQMYLAEVDEVFGPDPFAYGIAANAKAFDMAQSFSLAQGLTTQKQSWDEIFPQEIMYSEERL